ncbi:MAG: M24 family metallopeptidase, partial [Sphingobacteriales bacterium]
AIQRGYGIFDFLKTINGKAIFIEDHFNRFYASANALNLPVKYDRETLLSMVYDLMKHNQMPNSGIKMILTGGFSADGYSMAEPNLIINQTPFKMDESSFDRGLRLITHNHQRQLANIKTIDYLQAILLQPKVKEQLADDILYHHNGAIRECPRANFFMVKGNTKSLEAGMCFSIEPNISIVGEFGVRLEDCVYMTDAGPKWFSQPSKSLREPFA